jgi:hypothetical protein
VDLSVSSKVACSYISDVSLINVSIGEIAGGDLLS